MTKRLDIIYSELLPCKVFADIGCDHGYIVKSMLDGRKCEFAYASEISKSCLKKAEDLLSDYVDMDKVKCVVGDGFSSIENCDQALIAGMGGEEIIKICEKSKFLPDRLVLQPMKNADKVRVFVVGVGYKVVKDYVFFDKGKYYDLIVLEKGKDSLSSEEITYGRTNLLVDNPDFKRKIEQEILMLNVCLANKKVSENNRQALIKKIEGLKKYV